MSEQLVFTKMQGLGNDFVVINATTQPFNLSVAQMRALADRHFGVGCDQILVVEAARTPDTDFYYRIFNADGGEVEQCGNGARCFVRYVHEHGLITASQIRVGTRAGVIVLTQTATGEVTVNMGAPVFALSQIPCLAPALAVEYDLPLNEKTIKINILSMGNPHAVVRVTDWDAAPVARDGALIQAHPWFPQQVNVGFLQVMDRQHIRLRVYERGAGETLACGTGACAAVVAGIRQGWLDAQVRVTTRGGDLQIGWAGADAPVYMTGPAVTVFEGVVAVASLDGGRAA